MPNILFICGSMNQTTMMTQIASHLGDGNCTFTAYYGDGFIQRLASAGLLDSTILGNRIRNRTFQYLRQNGYPVDPSGQERPYHLVVTCSDLIIPRNIADLPIVLVQEGMTDPEDSRYRLVQTLKLPRYLANTSMTGLSHAYRFFCVASQGYKNLFVRKGIPAHKIAVTGIPNFDNAVSWTRNDFPYRGYVLAATSHLRETFKYENRKKFIRNVLSIADGRPVLFKLHPAEKVSRAIREIRRHAPDAMVMSEGNVFHMVANAEALVTRYSSVILGALALGKPVYSDYPASFLGPLTPIQNGGRSAEAIAALCREILG